jgi:hypothetical protein
MVAVLTHLFALFFPSCDATSPYPLAVATYFEQALNLLTPIPLPVLTQIPHGLITGVLLY